MPSIGFDADGNVTSITTYSATGGVVSATTFQYGADGVSVTATTTNAAGATTEVSSLSENPANGAAAVTENFISNGATTGSLQIASNAAGASTNITVSGQAPVQIDNATITISSGATAVVTGSNETVNIANGASATIVGQNDTVVFAGSGTASVSGMGDVVQLNSNDTLTLPGQASADSPLPNEQVTVTGGGTGDTVDLGSAIGATLDISGATINSTLFAGNGEGITINGNSDHVNSNGASIIFNGQGDSITLNSFNNTVIAGSGSADAVSITSATSYQNSCRLAGDDASFNLGANIAGSLVGDANTVSLSGNDQIDITAGLGDILNNVNSGDTVSMDSNTSADIQGSGAMIDLSGTGTTVTASNENIAFTNLTASILDDNLLGSHDVLSDPGNNSYSSLTIEGQYDTGFIGNIAVTVDGSDTGDTFTDPGGSLWDNSNTSGWDFGSSGNDICSDGYDPVILNLKGAAVSTVGLANSSVYFDMENTGTQIHTGWGTAGEGYLVFDTGNTNTVTNEHSLVSSFDELKGLDSNHDGVLNSLDAAWSQLKVWTDTAGNGIFTTGSMQTLSSLGITSINLNSTHVAKNSNNNTILDDSTFTWKNGTTGDIAGVAFTFDQNTLRKPIVIGGGGDACVHHQSRLPGGGVAGDVEVGSRMALADESTLEADTGVVTYSERKKAPGYRIVTVSGIALVCSETAPIPTREGLILAPALMGHEVAVRKDEGGSSLVGWEKVASVTSVGQIEIQHISINDKCFWAGESKDSFILHHNKIAR